MAKKDDDEFNQKLWNLTVYGFWGNNKELDKALPIIAVIGVIFVAGILLYLKFK